jgi:hypothetical protein
MRQLKDTKLNIRQCIKLDSTFTIQTLHCVPTVRTFNNSTFCPHSVFMCFVWISGQTAIISLYSINGLVCITEMLCVYCVVRTEFYTFLGPSCTLRWEAVGVVPPLGSSLKLRLSLRIHTDSEAARNVRYSALKGWDLQRQTLNWETHRYWTKESVGRRGGGDWGLNAKMRGHKQIWHT